MEDFLSLSPLTSPLQDPEQVFLSLVQTRFLQDVSLAPLCSIRTGGPARYYLEARDAEEIRLAWLSARALGLKVLLMGRGSNLLLPDSGFDGLVIHLGDDFSALSIQGQLIHAQAGISMKALATQAAEASLAGLAFAHGIPGSLGGALMMNAGAFSGEISQVVQSVHCMDPGGQPLSLSLEEAALSYRQSRMMKEGLLVLGATLCLVPGNRDALFATMAEFSALRREKQPLAWPSAGSFFKRPPGYFAGALIEQSGCKGLTVGGAQVSEKHAGFLINLGGATTADFLALKAQVQGRVMERFGVSLEPEVRIIQEG